MEPKYHATITLTPQPGQPAPDSYVELYGPWGMVRVHDPHTWGDINQRFAREKLEAAAFDDATAHGIKLKKEEIEVSIKRSSRKH
jgi:hypothetical protein